MRKFRLSYGQMIMIGFLLIILCGTLLLQLPIATRDATRPDFIDSLFTATSATCVTGLVVHDTFQYWSLFGQVVILCLIQVGGLGFMTVATMFSLAFRRKIGLNERNLMREASNTMHIGGVVRLTRHVLVGTFVIEGVCAVLLAVRFCPDMGFGTGVYFAIFHSVSAFCNAGFDLMGGRTGAFSSLSGYTGDPVVCFVIMFLIVMGGIGFLVWEDIYNHKWHWRRYNLHTKIVLLVTFFIIVFPSIFFFLVERQKAFAEFNTFDAIVAALFQSITMRTAGFSTVSPAEFTNGSNLLSIVLMLIGGSPGSTAGGMKTTTFFVVVLSLVSVVRNKSDLHCFKRRLGDDVLRRACSIFFVYISFAVLATIVICTLQPFEMDEVLYEVVSALCTVGVTMGITPMLSGISKLILTFLMYFGRVGVLSIILALTGTAHKVPIQYPSEKVMIG